ncbi:MAG: hypothetical protein HGA62_01905 [Chlorobiaceae bacterium]|nr:hypothetical protein [Chlorobiaceae bacterium]NTV59689.1 hypothetical protein [Chlorobiaceae bacterium]
MNPVRKKILERYEQTDDGRVIIDVASGRVEDLYEDFDRTAPYHRKDLEEDLVYYLTECVREIGRAEFVIRFTFEQLPTEELMNRVRTSVHKFFIYQKELEAGAMKKMLRTSLTLFVIGIAILGISLWLGHLTIVKGERSFLDTFFLEGITIVAWVSMWEGLAMLLINLFPHLNRIGQYISIAEAKIIFELQNADPQHA